MHRFTPAALVGCLVLGYLAGAASGTAPIAEARQVSDARGYPEIPLAPDQGQPVHWSAAELRTVHETLSARSNGRILSQPFDLLELPFTRTHFFNVVHRPPATGAPTAEQHAGVTDIYIVLGGSGTLTLGGEIEDRREVASRPGEYLGRLRGGQDYRVAAGDIVSVPPGTPHASSGDQGGLTYMLLKVNVGLYPWSLVSGAR